jgi:HPr kinase/phosphorylase
MPFLLFSIPFLYYITRLMKNDFITVRSLLESNKKRLKLKLVCSVNGLNKKIVSSELHRPGLALSGFTDTFTYHRIQILGNTEVSYLQQLPTVELKNSIDKLLEYSLPVIIITSQNEPPEYLVQAASRRFIPIITTPMQTTEFSHLLSDYLESQFAPKTSVHGSLVDVYGVGILFTGRSGIGKSEIALDLVERGHRLVADDLVMIIRKAEAVLIGQGIENSEHMMEIRGVGLVDIKRMFGIRGVRMQKRVEVEVKLEDWDENKEYERTGLDERNTLILDVEVPQVVLPINPGKNITVITETIAMNQLLKAHGFNPAMEFNRNLQKKMTQKGDSPLAKDRSHLGRDFE